MTREEAAAWVTLLKAKNLDFHIDTLDIKRNNIDIIQAYSEGKEIECKSDYSQGWKTIPSPAFDSSVLYYRVKPETKVVWYRNYVTPLGYVGLWVGKTREDVEFAEKIGKDYEWINEASSVEVERV